MLPLASKPPGPLGNKWPYVGLHYVVQLDLEMLYGGYDVCVARAKVPQSSTERHHRHPA